MKKLSILLVALLFSFTLLLTVPALATTEVDMSVALNGDPLYTNGTYTVYGGEHIIVTAGAWAGINRIGYYLVPEGEEKTDTIDVFDDFLDFTLPSYPAGTKVDLYIEALAADDRGAETTAKKTGWHHYELQYKDKPQVSMSIKHNDEPIEAGGMCFVSPGDTIIVNAQSEAGIERIGYIFDINGNESPINDVYEDSIEITVPEGSSYSYCILKIEAIANNDDGTSNTITKTGWYKIVLCYR